MIGTLRLAISSRISDSDDFKQLVIKSSEGSPVASFYRDASGNMVYLQDGSETVVPEGEILDAIVGFAQKGTSSLTCECWSGNVRIDIPNDGSGKIRISYSQSAAPPEVVVAENLIDPEEASDLLKAIEIANDDGSIKVDMRRKYTQIDNFLKLVQPLLSKSSKQGKIFILDCGSGKSYLSFVMNYFLREKLGKSCHFFCVDTNPDVMDKCIQIQKQVGYSNMEFHTGRIRDFQPSEKVDIVCSLHACDIASDEAIAMGIQLKAPFLLVVPCCQHEVINQLKDHPLRAMNRHGIYKARLADLLTDTMRTLILEAAGYKVHVTEYVSPIYTPKNIMIQAEKIQSGNKMAMEEYLELKTMFGDVSLELEKMLPELFS